MVRRFSSYRVLNLWQRAPVNIIGSPVVKALVAPPRVVAFKEGFKPLPDIGDGTICLEVYVLVLHGLPEPLDEDVVHPASPSHRDVSQGIGEVCLCHADGVAEDDVLATPGEPAY